MVIDSITSFTLLFEDQFSKRQSILALLEIIRKWDCTTLFTVQHDPSNTKEIPQIEFEADSITLLYLVKIKDKRKRSIEVLKMKGTNHSKEILPFTIDKGIKMGSKASTPSESKQ